MGGINKENIDFWLFEWKEGNLSSSDSDKLKDFLANNPEFHQEKRLWSESFVNPMPKAVYQHKASLTKKSKAIYPIIAAASLLLLIGSGVGIYFSKHNSDLEFNQLQSELLGLRASNENLSMSEMISVPETYLIENQKNKNSLDNQSQIKGKNSNNKINTESQNTTVGFNISQRATLHTTTKKVAYTSEIADLAISDVFNKEQVAIQNLEDNLNKDDVFDLMKDIDKSSEIPTHVNSTLDNESNDIAEDKLKYKTSKFKRFIDRFKNSMRSGSGLINLRQTDLVIAGYNHLDFNPSFAGSGFNFKVQSQAYGRWLNSENSLVGINASADGYIHSMKSSIGIKMNYENFETGMYQNANLSLYYSPKINISKSITLEPALKFVVGQRWMNEDKVNSGESIELTRGTLMNTFNLNEIPNGTKAWYKDLGFGLNLNTKWFYANVSVDNVLRHKTGVFSNSIDRASVDVTSSIGTNYQSYNKKWKISPFIAYKKTGDNHEMWAGSGASWKWITFGAGLSTKADVAANLGFKTKRFQMFYQFELTESKSIRKKLVGHQVTLRINTKPNRVASRNVNL